MWSLRAGAGAAQGQAQGQGRGNNRAGAGAGAGARQPESHFATSTTTDTVFGVRIPTLQLPFVRTPALQPVCCVCLCVCQPVFDAMILLFPREQ